MISIFSSRISLLKDDFDSHQQPNQQKIMHIWKIMQINFQNQLRCVLKLEFKLKLKFKIDLLKEVWVPRRYNGKL